MSELPGYTLDDPRQNARDAPYTFFLPSTERLEAVEAGDMVQLIFRPDQPGTKWGAERMWVTIRQVDGDRMEGCLDNEPDEMPCISKGASVRFDRHNIIGVVWAKDRATPPPIPDDHREYWERCLVDRGILSDGWWVYYLYREEPDLAGPDDKHPDSGWRIRGWDGDMTEEEMPEGKAQYVALGVVLNHDDSWLHLIDAPVGSAFFRRTRDEPFAPAE